MENKYKEAGINILSLFNGMNTGREALEQVGVSVDKYYSSEIKKKAIELTQFHYPGTIQVGNILNWKEWNIDWGSIDLVLSGSPCKDLSIAGKRKGINGKNSGLFWVFLDMLNHIRRFNPNVLFFQENVGSAPKKDIGIMSRALGVYPCRLNSSLVTAQLRDRYYWSNIRTKKQGLFGDLITDFPAPKDRKVFFKDILVSGFTDRDKAGALLASNLKTFAFKDVDKFEKYIRSRKEKGKQICNFVFESKQIVDHLEKHKDLVQLEGDKLKVKTNTKKGFDYATKDDCINLKFPTSKTRGGRITRGKSPALTESRIDLFSFNGFTIRPLNKIELCRLQGFPDNYCDILTRNHAAGLLGDGWTLPMIVYFFNFLPESWRVE